MFDIILFGLLFVASVFNIIKFLIIDKKYKIWLITVFYSISVILISSRLLFLVVYFFHFRGLEDIPMTWAYAGFVVATYRKIVLGIF